MAVLCTHLLCKLFRWLKSDLGLPRIDKMSKKLKIVYKTPVMKIRLPEEIQDALFNLNFRQMIYHF